MQIGFCSCRRILNCADYWAFYQAEELDWVVWISFVVQKNFEILCKFLGFISRSLRILSSSTISEILSVVIFGFCRGPFGQLRKNIAALNGPKYKARGLDRLLNEYFGSDPYLAGALTSVIIPSFDIKIQQPVFFSSWKVHPLCLSLLFTSTLQTLS